MELAANGELHHFIQRKRLKDSDIVFITAEVLTVLEYLTEQGVVHRDLKPSNVLFSEDMHVKIADLGAAREVE
jgi:3-phosphoinositide dependent protein kinase-1